MLTKPILRTYSLTADELERLVEPIYIAESYLKDKLGLLFRGGICYGKYYHKDSVTFGPAVVSAYKLEGKANYSRILLDEGIETLYNGQTAYILLTDAEKDLSEDGTLLPIYDAEGTVLDRGSEWRYNGRRNRLPTITVKTLDTTGAGDAFFAGALSVIDKNVGKPLTEQVLNDSLRFGNVAGALNTTGRGAIDNLPDLETINTYLNI